MPYTMRKVPNKKCYRVSKKNKTVKNGTRKVFSKCATKQNAIKQLRLLRALQYNKNFTPRKR
jgi:hypothetical protein